MSQEVVQTPVEPLVLVDDRTASLTPSMKPITSGRADANAGQRLAEKAPVMVDDDDDEVEEEEAASITSPGAAPIETASAEVVPLAATSPRIANLRVDSQNPLVFEPDPVEAAVTESAQEQQHDKPHADETTEKLTSPEIVTEPATPVPEPQQTVQPEPSATVDMAATLACIHDFLYHKIVENQCNSHAKEIHEFISTNLSDKQQAELIPQVVLSISQQFQKEAMGHEMSVDIQSSICLLEQMLLPEGRRSPLQDMYTAEEEEMLNQLAHTGSSNNVLN